MIAQSTDPAETLFTIVFVLGYVAFLVLAFGGLLLALAAIVSASRLPAEAFGPWWDNTKTTWLLGIAVGFVVPCGALVAGVYWFASGKRSITRTGVASRPFWAGPPKPPPPMYPPPV